LVFNTISPDEQKLQILKYLLKYSHCQALHSPKVGLINKIPAEKFAITFCTVPKRRETCNDKIVQIVGIHAAGQFSPLLPIFPLVANGKIGSFFGGLRGEGRGKGEVSSMARLPESRRKLKNWPEHKF
jgi:hypothetical protein